MGEIQNWYPIEVYGVFDNLYIMNTWKNPILKFYTYRNGKDLHCFANIVLSITNMMAHTFYIGTIRFVTSGLGQLSISDNWPQARLASQTIGSMKSWKNQNINLLLILHNNLHIHSKTYPKEASKAAKCRRLPGLPKVRWNPTSSGNFVRSQKTTLGNFSCLSFTI